MDLPQLTEFFQWMTIIHVVLLTLTSLLLMALKGVVGRLHGRLFGISEVGIHPCCGRWSDGAV